MMIGKVKINTNSAAVYSIIENHINIDAEFASGYFTLSHY